MLAGRTALVTGSTRGLGLKIAEALAAEGCNIMLNGFGDGAAIERQTAALAKDHGVEAAHHGADLSRPAEIEDLVGTASARFGAVDILVNNAVIRYFAEIPELDPDDWNHALAVNLSAPFHLTRLLLPAMRRRGWGRIVNLSSVMGLAARSGRVDYITTKTALIGLTRATAAETRRDPDITCNAVCPGSVLTANTEIKVAELAAEEGLDDAAARREFLRRRHQPGGFIEPARIGRFIAYLCQDEARDIHGAVIPIDTGRSAAWLDDGQPLPES